MEHADFRPGARRTSPRVGLSHGKRRLGFGERRSWARTSFRGNCCWRARERSRATGYAVSGQPGGNRVATSSVRPAVLDSEPERVAPAAPMLLFSSYAAAVMEQPEPVVGSSRVVGNQRSGLNRSGRWTPRVRESGMPCCFCKLPPCDYGAPLGWDSAPGIGFLVRLRLAPRWVVLPAGAPRGRPANASAWVRTKRR